MAMLFDREHDQKLKPTIYPAVLKGATQGDVIIDTQGFKAVVGYIVSGVISDGSAYPFKVMVGNDPALGDGVLATDLSGADPLLLVDEIEPDGAPSDQAPGTVAELTTDSLTFGAADGNKVKRFGYVGPYRYIRVDLAAPTGQTAGGLFGAFIELTEADRKPVVQD
jgi:hypothetical protein